LCPFGAQVVVDPLFQRVLAQECRARGLPIVMDEVASGLFRLGVPSAATDLLQVRKTKDKK
jgi:bifunctional dethiobiotin synthetase / adenosylmethionine---8-amino-7-oxononanoate aminotransferase